LPTDYESRLFKGVKIDDISPTPINNSPTDFNKRMTKSPIYKSSITLNTSRPSTTMDVTRTTACTERPSPTKVESSVQTDACKVRPLTNSLIQRCKRVRARSQKRSSISADISKIENM
jgi:hypothetical protein